MAFIVEQKIKDTVYVYRSEGYWDREKGHARHKRIFIGKKDPKTGKIIPSKSAKPARTCKDYGNYHFLFTIAEQTGLLPVLQNTFPDTWREILTCSFYEISERKPLYLCGPWCQSTTTIEETKLSSQRISELIQNLGSHDRDRMKFFRAWAQKHSEQECIAYDITSVSSYSKLNEFLEFGYNRDGEDLSQINLAMLFGEKSLLPIFYSIVQGSIRDMSTLSNMIKYAKDLNIDRVRFVMDKGFFSDANIKEMAQNHVKYAIGVPFTTTLAKTHVDMFREDLKSPGRAFYINGDILQGIMKKIKLVGQRGYIFVYFNERLYLDQKENLMKRILRLEQKIEGRRKLSAGLTDPCMKYLKTRKTKQGICVKRNEEKIEKALRYKGYLVMVSNNVKEAKECLHLYRSKDAVERSFDNIKNELDMRRFRIHSELSMHGRTFLTFISLILHSWIDKKMKETNLYKKYTQEEVMAELKKLKIIELSDNKKILTEISKTQEDIFKLFTIPKPSEVLL